MMPLFSLSLSPSTLTIIEKRICLDPFTYVNFCITENDVRMKPFSYETFQTITCLFCREGLQDTKPLGTDRAIKSFLPPLIFYELYGHGGN